MPGDVSGILGWHLGRGNTGTSSLHTLKAVVEMSDPLGGPTSPRAHSWQPAFLQEEFPAQLSAVLP